MIYNLKENNKTFNTPNEIFDDLLSSNGVTDEDQKRRFFNPSFSDLYDPFLMKNMDKAVERINCAIENKETILVFGDYDCDGICATSILTKYLVSCGVNVIPYLPSRNDGYGLSVKAIESVSDTVFPDLVITCDCGITATKEVEELLDIGLDVIVTDHHEPGEEIPNCIVLDPKQIDCNYPFKDLCGAGVVLKLVSALDRDINNIKKYFGLAMFATIADVVPLVDENRTIAKLGIDIFNSKDNKVLFALESGYKPISFNDIGYRLAPKINSAGRIKDPNIALQLFLSEDEHELLDIVADLNVLNEKRRELSNNVYNDIVSQLSSYDLYNKKYIMLKGNWEVGVIGVASSRICEEYNVPTILFSIDNDELHGSARAPKNINLVELFSSAKDILINGGGHKQAGGLSLKESFYDELINRFDNFFSDKERLDKEYTYDYDLSNIRVDDKFVKTLKQFEPFGIGNKEPVFKISTTNSELSFLKSQHISSVVNNIKIIKFFGNDSYNVLNQQIPKELYFRIDYNTQFNSISGILSTYDVDLIDKYEANEHEIDKICLGLNLKAKNNIHKYNNINDLKEILAQNGLLLVCSSTKSYIDNKDLIDSILGPKYPIDLEHKGIKYPESRVVINPAINYDYSLFNKVIILDKITKEEENYYSQFIQREVYVLDEYKIYERIVNRDKLGVIYLNIEKNINKHRSYNLYEIYKLAGKCSFNEFLVAFRVFEELKLFKFDENNLIILKGKNDLNNSKIYNYFKE